MSDSYDDYESEYAGSIEDTYCKKHKGLWQHECGCDKKSTKKVSEGKHTHVWLRDDAIGHFRERRDTPTSTSTKFVPSSELQDLRAELAFAEKRIEIFKLECDLAIEDEKAKVERLIKALEIADAFVGKFSFRKIYEEEATIRVTGKELMLGQVAQEAIREALAKERVEQK